MKKLEKDIGCELTFRYLPSLYLDGIISCDMTSTWRKNGLNIERGKNHFTMGKVVDGRSTRFNPDSGLYQSWLGGYTVKLSSEEKWNFKNYFDLAIADQNSWLSWYGSQNPETTTEGWKPKKIGLIRLGHFKGKIYEYGCNTHSDVGAGRKPFKLYFAAMSMSSLFNIQNPQLKLKYTAFLAENSRNPHEHISLRGYFAIFNVKKNVKVVLYGNGLATGPNTRNDTFLQLKNEILTAMKRCRIDEDV